MTKIYLVSDGDYSDYSVCGVFSTEEKANQFIKHFKMGEIEEYELDPIPDNVYKENKKLFFVRMQRNGKVDNIYKIEPHYFQPPEFRKNTFEPESELFIYVWANDQKHAIKIVNEKRTQLIANNLWGKNIKNEEI